jgi:flavin reductase (DIM6/NTAB) family NADH-FMN oxidoreductase RutF/rubredoxin
MINFESFFKVSYGLYIVSSGNGKSGNGFISNSVFQVTAEPPQFAACCNKNNFTAELIQQSGAFSISVLHQMATADIIGRFGYKSGRDGNKMHGLDLKTGNTGVPIVLNDALAFFECKLIQTCDVGTHLMFVGEVVQADILNTLDPLTYAYYREIRRGVAPKNAPTYIDKSKLIKKVKEEISGDKYKCPACGYIYDPAMGDISAHIDPGTQFSDLPDTWICPTCGTEKEDFFKI